MWGYQTSCLQDGRCSIWKENILNMHSKEDFIQVTLLVIVAPILKVIRNLVQTFHLHACSQFDVVQISNDYLMIMIISLDLLPVQYCAKVTQANFDEFLGFSWLFEEFPLQIGQCKTQTVDCRLQTADRG